MSRMIKTNNIANAHSESVISDLILIDRDVDYASVLLSQLNYEGLLDEVFEVKSGKMNIDNRWREAYNNSFHK